MEGRDLDAVMAELAGLRAELDAADPSDETARRDLLTRREALRAEARGIQADADPAGTVNRLRHELAGLTRQWEELAGKRIDVIKQAGGGSGGGDFGFVSHAMDVNREIDTAGGRAEIEARVAEIRRLLAEIED